MVSKPKRVLWDGEESSRVQELYPDHSITAIVKIINSEFWKGEAVRTYWSIRGLARRHDNWGLSERKKTVSVNVHQLDPGYLREKLPEERQPVEELIEERKKKYNILEKNRSSAHAIPVKVTLDGAIGIAVFGDPHLDDDGTNIAQVMHHVNIVRNCPGMFAGNIGDTQNNWVGRLSYLYGQQSTSAYESWQLTEYFVKSLPWLFIIGGNHDLWSGVGDPLKWISGDGTYTEHGSRLSLNFPNGRKVLINARHQWAGVSQWNTAHSISKAAQMGWDDHVLLGGHTHVSGYQVVKNPSSGRVSHCLQIASYKEFDKFAEQRGFANKNVFNCPVVIINPNADKEINLIHIVFDPKEGAEYLTWLRSKG